MRAERCRPNIWAFCFIVGARKKATNIAGDKAGSGMKMPWIFSDMPGNAIVHFCKNSSKNRGFPRFFLMASCVIQKLFVPLHPERPSNGMEGVASAEKGNNFWFFGAEEKMR